MHRFVFRTLLLGGSLLLLNAGCVSLPPSNGPLIPPVDGGTANTPPELPPAEAAKVCLATAENLERGGQEAEAAALYERARELDPRLANQITRRLASVYSRLGQFDRAKQEYEKALAQNPRDADLLCDLGYSHYCRGLWDEAEKRLRQALEHNPKHGRAWTNLGMTLGQQGRYDEGLQAFEKVVSPGQARCNLAFILSTQGKHEEARQAYREALQREPDLQLARVALAKLEDTVQTERRRPTTETASPESDRPGTPLPLSDSILTEALPRPFDPMKDGLLEE